MSSACWQASRSVFPFFIRSPTAAVKHSRVRLSNESGWRQKIVVQAARSGRMPCPCWLRSPEAEPNSHRPPMLYTLCSELSGLPLGMSPTIVTHSAKAATSFYTHSGQRPTTIGELLHTLDAGTWSLLVRGCIFLKNVGVDYSSDCIGRGLSWRRPPSP